VTSSFEHKMWQTLLNPLSSVLEPSNWVFLAVGPPSSINLFRIVFVTSFPLSDGHRKIAAGGVTLFPREKIHLGGLQKITAARASL